MSAVPNSAKGDVNEIVDKCHQAIDDALKSTRKLFAILADFMAEFSRRSAYSTKIRLTDDTRIHPAWSDVELIWDSAGTSMADVSKALGILYTMLTELEGYDVPNWEELLSTLNYYRGQLDEIRSNMHVILAEPSRERILWVAQDANKKVISLHNAPLHVGNLVHEHLLKPKESVIFTSATLRTNNSFEYFQERLHLWGADEVAVGSPFDYENNTLVYVPTDLPETNTPGYQKSFEAGLLDLVLHLKGRTLVLFTAYSQLRNTAKAIRGPLADAGIVVHQQGDGTGRRQMLENFKNDDHAVLLGTRSFWEGVDIPGPDLSCVVIARLPFAVPSDPIVAARAETFEDSFYQYSIPEAILMFRQGFGRLIRTKDDRGVVAVFDRRVISKGYGHAFLDSLPDAVRQQGAITDLPHLAEQWIDYGGI
jgi:DNA polymerase-3 subunit epsilon/ATP-dependent DNA helicase DinG